MASFGETLKCERETRNISLREVASATKISIRYLEALEENRFDVLPGGVFNKGFVRAFANHLGLDGEAMVARYLQEVARRSEPGLPAPSLPVILPPAPSPPAPAPLAAPPAAAAAGMDRPRSPTITFAAKQPAPPRRSRGLLIALGVVAAASLIPLGFRIFSAYEGTSGTEPLPEQTAMTRDAAEARPAEAPVAGFGAPDAVGATRSTNLEKEDPVSAPPEPARLAPPKPAPWVEKPLPAAKVQPAPATPRPAAPSPTETVRIAGAEGPRPAPAAIPPAQTPAADSAVPGAGAERDPEPPPIVRRAVPAPALTAGGLAPRPHPGTPGSSAQQPETMSVQIDSTRKTWVYLFCDSAEVIDRRMLPGETLKFDCLSVIRVSSHDAGAVHLTINGAPCMPLGEDGAEVYGYTIRIDDFRLICPRRAPAGGGRP